MVKRPSQEAVAEGRVGTQSSVAGSHHISGLCATETNSFKVIYQFELFVLYTDVNCIDTVIDAVSETSRRTFLRPTIVSRF